MMPGLPQWIDQRVERALARSTRIHLLPKLGEHRVFVKREDELSSGIVGSKLRKYASVLPCLKREGIEEVALVGGPNSNNLVGLLQLLKERSIQAWLFLRQPGDRSVRGNALLLELLLPDQRRVFRIERSRWGEAPAMAEAFVQQRREAGARAAVVPEGAAFFASLPGAMTLAEDLLANEASSGQRFDTIYVDSGTGIGAAGLVLGLAGLDSRARDRTVRITLIAGNRTGFEDQLRRLSEQLRQECGNPVPELPRLDFLAPPFLRAYGSVGPRLFKATRAIACEEGLLMDPVYSVKHYAAMKTAVLANPSRRPSLFIYNGGTLGLAGFQRHLSETKERD